MFFTNFIAVGIYCQDDLQSFLKEAEIMQHFDHDNVVKLLGTVHFHAVFKISNKSSFNDDSY